MRIDVNELPEEMTKLFQKAWCSDVIVLKDGQPWMKIARHEAYRPTVKPGLFPDLFGGEYELPDDFRDTPEDIIEDFYK